MAAVHEIAAVAHGEDLDVPHGEEAGFDALAADAHDEDVNLGAVGPPELAAEGAVAAAAAPPGLAVAPVAAVAPAAAPPMPAAAAAAEVGDGAGGALAVAIAEAAAVNPFAARRAQLEEQRRFLVAERERLYEAMRAEARRRDRLRERARGLSREDLILLLGENLRAEAKAKATIM